MKGNEFEVIIVGGGPAGLTCALVLGRCGRNVAVFDTGKQRNSVSGAMHGFPSRDGIDPKEFIASIRKELSVYGINIVRKKIITAKSTNTGFEVTDADGRIFRSQLLLLATGMRDTLPALPGAERFFGKGVYHCPYCDGWEHRGKHWLVWTPSAKAATEVCLRLRTWTKQVTLLAAYCRRLSSAVIKTLEKNGVRIENQRVKTLYGKARLQGVEWMDGSKQEFAALFFSTRAVQHASLARQLGCKFNKQGQVRADRLQQTCVRGLYVAGDMARDMELVVIAAAEGAKAGVAMNTRLNRETRKSRFDRVVDSRSRLL